MGITILVEFNIKYYGNLKWVAFFNYSFIVLNIINNLFYDELIFKDI